MKPHLPTALRRALLAITALLSPSVVTTTIATATLAAITAPTMADDLTLNANSNAFATNLTVDELHLASGVTSATLEPDRSTITTLTVTADSINLASDQKLYLSNAKIIANKGIHTLLAGVDGKDSISMNTCSIWGSGGSSANDVLLSSFINDKLFPNSQAYVYITKGHIQFDVGIDNYLSCNLGDGESEDSGSVSATISSELESLKIVSVASDATLDLGGGSKDFILNIRSLEGTVKTGRNLKLTGIEGWDFGDASIRGSSSVCVEENSEASITLEHVRLMGGSVSAHNIILKNVTAYDNYKSTLTATNELHIQGNIGLKNTIANAGSTIIADEQSLTLGKSELTTGAVSIGEGATLDLGSSTTNLKGIITNNGTLVLGGTITVDDTAFTAGTRERYSAGNNGYKITDTTYNVLSGTPATGSAKWKVGTQSATYEDGMVIVAGIEDTAVYYVRNGDVAYTRALANDTTTFSLDGGHLVLNESLKDTQSIEWKSTASWLNINNDAVELKSSQLSTVGAGNFTLITPNGGTYIVDKKVGDIVELTLGTGVTLFDEHWWGWVKTVGDTTASSDLDTTGWKNTELNGTTTVNSGVTLTLGGNTKLKGQIVNNGTLKLGGNITIDSSTFAAGDVITINPHYQQGSKAESMTSGFLSVDGMKIKVVTGNAADATDANWSVSDVTNGSYTFDAASGELHVVSNGSVGTAFYINTGDAINYGKADAAFTNINGQHATELVLNGGNLVLSTELLNSTMKITANKAGSVEIGNNVNLYASQLDASVADVSLTGKGAYTMANGANTLGEGVNVGTGWTGTVYTGELAAGMALDAAKLGTDDSTLWLGNRPMRRNSGGAEVVLKNLTAANVGDTVVPGALTLQAGASTTQNLEVQGMLTLGTADSSASLTANGTVTLQGLTFGHADSTMQAEALGGVSTLDVQLAEELLGNKKSGTTLTLVTLTQEGFDGAALLNGEDATGGIRSTDNRREFTLDWNEDGTILTLTVRGTETYVTEQVKPSTGNGKAGVALLTDVFLNDTPEEGGALESLLKAVDAGTLRDRDAAAVAGASTAVLGQALSVDVERQLRAIRNRSISGAYGRDAVALNDGKVGAPSMTDSNRYFAWVNAEGNRAEQNADGCAAGYTLSSWGGTVGAGMQVNNQLTLGLALTAMYGDLQSDGPDSLDGDMDTAYLSAFARYNRGRWSHAFIGTVGTMEADYKRTAMGYSNTGDTEGTSFGLMYELSRDYALSNNSSISPVFNVSYRHIAVDGYSERGTDAALNVGEQSLDTVTVGLGARYAAVLGQQTLNCACAFEARALAKYDFGDTQTDTNVGFINHATRSGIKSAEMGAFGVELGAGISVPVGSGSIFADGAVELRSEYTDFNATVGYKIQF